MSQHDFDIANQTASNTRVDINNALKALGSLSSGAAAPTTTYANMLWFETDTQWLWMRNEADSAWLRILYIDQANGSSIQDNTKIVDTSGAQTGLLGDQTTATWQAGTGTTESLVSPAKVKATAAGSYSLSTNGYQVLPSGLIMQWGQVTGVNANTLKTVTFPTGFTSEVYSIQVTPKDNRASNDFEVDLYSVAAEAISNTQFTIMQEGTQSGTNQTMYFQAIGV